MKTQYRFLILFFIVVIILHLSWINVFGGPLTDGDFFYIPFEALKSVRLHYFTTWLSDFGMGRALIDLSQAPTYFLPGVFAFLFGLDNQISSRIVYFIPILFFSIFGSYKLFGYLSKNNHFLIGVGFSIYFLNTYSLTLQTGHITLAVAYSILPLTLFHIIKALHEHNNYNAILGSIFLILLGYYETRLLFIVTFIILCISIGYFIQNKKSFKQSIIIFFTIIFGNLFWLLPYKFLGFSNGEILDRALFGAGYWDLLHSISLHQSWWNTYKGTQTFIESYPPMYLFIIPFIFIFCTIILLSQLKFKKYYSSLVYSFLLISLLGIFLGKMSDAPFPNIYQWLYENFPFFNAFREPTKFYMLTAIGYSIIIILGLQETTKKNRFILGSLIFLVGFLNLINHSLNNYQLFKEKNIPPEYTYLETLLENDSNFGRVLWVPTYSRWGYYSYIHPPINFIETGLKFFPQDINKIDIYYGIDFYRNFENFFKSKYAKNIIETWGVKYIILPVEEKDLGLDIYINYGGNEVKNIKNEYYSILQQQDFLDEISKNDSNLKIFKLENNIPKFLSSQTNIFSQSHTKYSLGTILKLTELKKIKFLESFHPEWKLYLEPYSEIDCRNPNIYSGSLNQKIESYTIQAGDDYQKIVASQSGVTLDILRELNPEIDERELKIGQVITLKKTAGESYSVTECESENRFYVGGELSKLWEKPIFDDTHTMIYDYANQWTIDPEYIKSNYSKEYYRENPDGSIDVRMTLYFKPQSYFYLGLMISAATLILLLSYLGYDVVISRRRGKIDVSKKSV